MDTKNRTVKWLRRHRLLIGSIAGIICLWGISSAVVWQRLHESASAQKLVYQQQFDEADKILQQLKEKKEADQQAKEERAKKEAEEAAAKRAVEETAVAPTPTQAGGSVSCNTATKHTNPTSVDVVVNKKHCLVPLRYAPSDLVTSHGATLSAKAVNDFNRMYTDAAAAGQPFSVSSSYRSYDTQVSTYNYWVSVSGQAGADTYSARPGFSEHQTGFVIDVAAGGCTLNCFGGTSQYQWFQENAAKYGFIQRYYAGYEHITGYVSEEWHYRYVGAVVAQDMKTKGIKTLEEYFGVEGGDYR